MWLGSCLSPSGFKVRLFISFTGNGNLCHRVEMHFYYFLSCRLFPFCFIYRLEVDI